MIKLKILYKKIKKFYQNIQFEILFKKLNKILLKYTNVNIV